MERKLQKNKVWHIRQKTNLEIVQDFRVSKRLKDLEGVRLVEERKPAKGNY